MSELKCCPFCGGEAREYKQRFLFYEKAVDMACCDKCGFSLVKSVWNTRTPMANIVEKLEEELKLTREAQTIECIGNNGNGTPLQSKYSGER